MKAEVLQGLPLLDIEGGSTPRIEPLLLFFPHYDRRKIKMNKTEVNEKKRNLKKPILFVAGGILCIGSVGLMIYRKGYTQGISDTGWVTGKRLHDLYMKYPDCEMAKEIERLILNEEFYDVEWPKRLFIR